MGYCRVPLLTGLLLLFAGHACAQLQSDVSGKNLLSDWRFAQDISLPGYGTSSEVTASSNKSVLTAVGLSLLLPGAGHVYAGSGGRAKFFLGAEAVVWGLALAFDRRAAWKLNSATDHAVLHSQVQAEGKSDEFLEYLEFYDNRDEFNTAGRIIEPDREFLPENRSTYWQWDSEGNRQIYRDLRNASSGAARNRTFMFYAAILTRAVSAVDAFRVVRQHTSSARDAEGLKLSVKPRFSLRNPGIALNARYSF